MDMSNTQDLNSDVSETSDVPGGVDAPSGSFSEGEPPEDTNVTVTNPALQAPEGPPVVFNRDGSIRKKPGRKLGQKTGDGAAHKSETAKPAKTAAMVKAQTMTAEQTARLLLKTSVGIMGSMVGPEWDFESQDEANGMLAVVTAYIDAKGGADMSPDAVLLLAIAGYAMPRAKHPNTREKFSAFFGKVFKGFRALFNR